MDFLFKDVFFFSIFCHGVYEVNIPVPWMLWDMYWHLFWRLYNYNWHVYPTSVPLHTAPTENPNSMHFILGKVNYSRVPSRDVWKSQGRFEAVAIGFHAEDGCYIIIGLWFWSTLMFLYGDLSFFHVHTYGWTRFTRCHGDKNTGQLIWGYDDMYLSSLHHGPLLFLNGVIRG